MSINFYLHYLAAQANMYVHTEYERILNIDLLYVHQLVLTAFSRILFISSSMCIYGIIYSKFIDFSPFWSSNVVFLLFYFTFFIAHSRVVVKGRLCFDVGRMFVDIMKKFMTTFLWFW